jgi:hypothetical protein
VSYVDAGYSICLTVLFLYGVSLILRRRRLLRAADIAQRDAANCDATVAPTGAAPDGAAGIDVGNER